MTSEEKIEFHQMKRERDAAVEAAERYRLNASMWKGAFLQLVKQCVGRHVTSTPT